MKKVSRIIASMMLAAAIIFVWFVLKHPEASWPWGNAVSFTLYSIYVIVLIILFIAPFQCKK